MRAVMRDALRVLCGCFPLLERVPQAAQLSNSVAVSSALAHWRYAKHVTSYGVGKGRGRVLRGVAYALTKLSVSVAATVAQKATVSCSAACVHMIFVRCAMLLSMARVRIRVPL